MLVQRFITDADTSARMGRVARTSTRPEAIVKYAVSRMGLRYRKNVHGLPGQPDLANISKRWAIFVNGCFWHGHAGCRRATKPVRNHELWARKFRRNRDRDKKNIALLKKMGFRVLVVWECETKSPGILDRKLGTLFK
jgi:DNA mismatch endonuclease, patch repair protein